MYTPSVTSALLSEFLFEVDVENDAEYNTKYKNVCLER